MGRRADYKYAVLLEELSDDNGILALTERLQKALAAPHDLAETEVVVSASMLSGRKTMGVQVHIDDFGTGCSSLEALHDLSIHALKIDRSFIFRLSTSPRSCELDRDVIAEGSETPRTRLRPTEQRH